MSKDYSFNVMPSVSISRSRFVRKSQHKTSFNLGDLVPIYVDEVLPGDTRSMDLASLVRMSTPIAPLMDNIYLDFYAFFVPNRIVWIHWKEFIGENNTSAGIPSVSYSIPTQTLGAQQSGQTIAVELGSVADYFGLPQCSSSYDVSALPFRGYYAIYNRWFRDQNLIAPIPVDTSDNNRALVPGMSTPSVAAQSGIRKVAKLADYFTKALPFAQKGTAVSIPLGGNAPVISGGNNNAHVMSTTSDTLIFSGLHTTPGANDSPMWAGSSSIPVTTTTLIADLSTATAATINQLRYAFQLQKFLEKDALYGTRYWEILAAHFGVEASDASLQDPEYLGGSRVNINIDQVLSTAGYSASTSTEVGQPGANSVTAHKGSLFTKSFTEHGYIFILCCARHDSTYGQGVNRMWFRSSRYDFYWPVFANLGAQEIKNKEIYMGSSATRDGTFGYQEAWAEYRYKPSIVTGKLRPNISGNLKFWTLAERFGSLPTLSQSFIEQGRDNIKDALVSGSSGPDFVGDFYFKDIAVRPMPVYSIPGLIDHH